MVLAAVHGAGRRRGRLGHRAAAAHAGTPAGGHALPGHCAPGLRASGRRGSLGAEPGGGFRLPRMGRRHGGTGQRRRLMPMSVHARTLRLARLLLPFALVALLLILAPAHAAQPAAPSWSQLSPQQRELLAPLERRWDRMPPVRRARLALLAERWAGMDQDQRRAARERLARWRGLNEERRALRRERWQQFQD